MNAASRKIEPTPGDGELIDDCQPCELALSRTGPTYSIQFEVDSKQGGRTVRALHLLRSDRPQWSQTLTVHDMLPIAAHEKFIFGATDLNFDGYADLSFSTRRGASNVYSDYWLFVRARDEFEYLGNYPTFRVDPLHRDLSTYEGGGIAGLIYERDRYRFIGGKLTLILRDKQDETDDPDVFIRTLYRLERGKMREVSRQRVPAPQPKE